MRTIDEYVRAKKRLSLDNFTAKDIEQIKQTEEGFFIVNDCKVPVRNGTLNLTSWLGHVYVANKQSSDEKKKSQKASQKKYREKQKNIRSGILIKEKTQPMTYTPMSTIFRDFHTSRKQSDSPKRIVTAQDQTPTAKPKVHYGQYKAKRGANIPIQHLIQLSNYLKNLAKDKGERSKKGEYRHLMTVTERVNKHYVPRRLYLVACNGKRYEYTTKGLVPTEV